MGVEPYLISSAVIGIMAQRLVRRVCASCGAPAQPDPPLLLDLGGAGGGEADYRVGGGCEVCNRTGFQGRLVICEILLLTEELRRLVLQRTAASVIREAAIPFERK